MKLTGIQEALAVGAGGFAGAILRHAVIGVIGSTFGILAVNILGCFALGMFSQNSRLTLFLATGFLGALTTFSAYGGHAVYLWNNGQLLTASLFVFVNVIAGISAFVLGAFLNTKFVM